MDITPSFNFMIRIVLLFWILPISLFAQESPANIDFSETANFITTHDPGYIVIKLDSGEIIDTTYAAIDFKTLHQWKKDAQKVGINRRMKVTYTNKNGLIVRDIATGTKFTLNGIIKNHPIDLWTAKCRTNSNSTIDIQQCQNLQLEAWNAELNRIYNALGGKTNSKLKDTQSAWIKFKNAQIHYLKSYYVERDGTMWSAVYLDHVIDITRSQTKRLKSIQEW